MMGRSVVLFQEIDPEAPLGNQKQLGTMSHWQAKRMDEQKPEGIVYFTVTSKQYEQAKKDRDWSLVDKHYISKEEKPRRKRRKAYTMRKRTQKAITAIGENILEEKAMVFEAYTQLLNHRIQGARSQEEKDQLNQLLNKVCLELQEVVRIPVSA